MNLYVRLSENKEDILQIATCDMLNYYHSERKKESIKILPLLQHLHQYYIDQKNVIRAAHTSFLIAYCYLIPYILNRERNNAWENGH